MTNRITRRAAIAGAGALGLSACGTAPAQRLGPNRRAKPGRAAFLLPLSGPGAGLGAGLQVAAQLGSSGVVGPSAEIELLDSGPSADTAARAAKAAITAGAQMIVGPLFAAQTPEVVRAAKGVPVVTLSNDVTLAKQGAWVFGLTPAQSAQAILGFAAGRGVRRIVAVAPDGAFGTRALAAAQQIAKSVRVDLQAVTSDAAGIVDHVRRAGKGTRPDAVYLPAGGADLAAHVEALRGMDVQLLGSAQWLGADISGRAFQGAWFAAPDPMRFEPFARAFESASDQPAGILGGLAFDAVEMARLLGRGGLQSPKGLSRKDGFDGVLGPFRFASSRICQRGLAVLQVNGDGAVSLVGSTAI